MTTTTDSRLSQTDPGLIGLMRESMDGTADSEGRSFLQQAFSTLEFGVAALSGSDDPLAAGVLAQNRALIADIQSAMKLSAGTLTATGPGTIDTGRYTISAGAAQDGSLSVVDNQTNKAVTVWGDPHIMVNGRNVADFQAQGMNMELADGTLLRIDPTPEKNGVAHIAAVTVQKGKQQAVFSGIGGTFQNGATLAPVATRIMTQSLVDSWGSGPTLSFGDNGKLSTTKRDGSADTVLVAGKNGAQTDIDKIGGGFVY